MKNITFYMVLCVFAMCLMTACEKANTYTGNGTQAPITSRGECDDCPDTEQCCCYVELDPNDNNGSASIFLCGTDGGATFCSPVSHSCLSTSWNNGAYNLSLTSASPRQNFCMQIGTVFYIQNTSSTDAASIKISCQRGEANPQIITITLQPNERILYETETDCDVVVCN